MAFVDWVRMELWQNQVPATVLAHPSGGAAVTFDSGQVMVFPTPDAIRWFLAGWDARERTQESGLLGSEVDTGDADGEPPPEEGE